MTDAIAKRRFSSEGKGYKEGDEIKSLPENQFNDWAAAGLVVPAEAKPAKITGSKD